MGQERTPPPACGRHGFNAVCVFTLHAPHARPMRPMRRSKVQEAELAKAAASLSAARQQAHGSARFNERIRTYQYVVSAWGFRGGRLYV